MDVAHYITLIKDAQETVPNMMEPVVTSLWKTDAGPATVHVVLMNAPSLATFVVTPTNVGRIFDSFSISISIPMTSSRSMKHALKLAVASNEQSPSSFPDFLK
jgi:hypothetical protein